MYKVQLYVVVVEYILALFSVYVTVHAGLLRHYAAVIEDTDRMAGHAGR